MSDEEHLRGPIEIRHTGKVAGVSFPKRTIEIVVVPYDEPTLVEHRGRMIRESVAPGSFDGIERRANRVRVNYHHQDDDLRHLLGHALTFHPSRQEGLVSVVQIRKGEYGDMALEAAEDGDLGASGGFGVMAGGESWPDRQTRRLTRLFLDHIALTPTPAYEGAQVLAVRHTDAVSVQERPATPIRDALELQQLRDEYARIDARWNVQRAG
jgi:HK97 family phage prohead protease